MNEVVSVNGLEIPCESEKNPADVTICLPVEGAQVLLRILRFIGGNPTGPRRYISAICEGLYAAKIKNPSHLPVGTSERGITINYPD